jgi:predicted metal-binding membrane protein
MIEVSDPRRATVQTLKIESMPSLTRERLLASAALLLLCGLAWAYLLCMAHGMAHMDLGAEMAIMPRMTSWQTVDLALVFVMWAIMMVAMMLPSATPMILTFVALEGTRREARPRARLLAFAAGYVAIWSGFSLLATLLQWGLLEGRLISPMMRASSPWLGGGLLLATGLYQLTSVKSACLARCRYPLEFLTVEWREGGLGALLMGVRHGLFCLGCCGPAMLLLFVFGVMNVLWIATLAAFILAEKLLPVSDRLRTAAGILLLGWSAAVLLRAVNG